MDKRRDLLIYIVPVTVSVPAPVKKTRPLFKPPYPTWSCYGMFSENYWIFLNPAHFHKNPVT